MLPLFATRFDTSSGGHLGHFHRAISHLNWYEIVCMGDVICISSQMKSRNMFSVYLRSEIPRHLFIIKPHCFHVCVYQCRPQTLATIWRNMGICGIFTLCPPRKIYLGFILFAMIGLGQIRGKTLLLYISKSFRCEPEISWGDAWYHETDCCLKWPCVANFYTLHGCLKFSMTGLDQAWGTHCLSIFGIGLKFGEMMHSTKKQVAMWNCYA